MNETKMMTSYRDSTRSAVESAIKQSKQNRTRLWQEIVRQSRKSVLPSSAEENKTAEVGVEPTPG